MVGEKQRNNCNANMIALRRHKAVMEHQQARNKQKRQRTKGRTKQRQANRRWQRRSAIVESTEPTNDANKMATTRKQARTIQEQAKVDKIELLFRIKNKATSHCNYGTQTRVREKPMRLVRRRTNEHTQHRQHCSGKKRLWNNSVTTKIGQDRTRT